MKTTGFRFRGELLVLAVLLLCCLAGCGESKAPVEIVEMNAFHKEKDTDDIMVYINWRNASEDKVIDALTLSVYCDADKENMFECQILEPDGIMPGLCNNKSLYRLIQSDLPIPEAAVLCVSISEVGFTDGTTWKSGEAGEFMPVEVDGRKGEGEFPAKLNAVHFYANHNDQAWSQAVYFQIDWTNISETTSIINVVYRIKAKSGEEEDAVYLSRYYAPSEWVSVLSDNTDKTYTDFINAPVLREKEGELYEFCIWKVIDAKGVVWENADSENSVEISLDGKKGYAFDSGPFDVSIEELIDRIAEEAEKQGLDMREPDVAVKDQEYCLLRYEDVDIRVELYKSNVVNPCGVRFICYAEPSDEALEIAGRKLLEKMETLRLCICAATLTELSYEEVLQSVDDYNNNNKDSIEFSDVTYKSFENPFYYKKAGEEALCYVFAAGKGFLRDALFW